MWETAAPLPLSAQQRMVLDGWARAHSSPQSLVRRSRIVLMAADGASNHAIARTLGLTRETVLLWRRRFAEGGPQFLRKVARGPGRKPTIPTEKVQEIIDATLQTKPEGATHFSCRTMAKAMGVSADTVNRIWRQNGLQPHRLRTSPATLASSRSWPMWWAST
jgi:transposase